MKTIVKIDPAIPQMPVRKKVAAYARVSMETERLSHSLSAQISHYSELIQKHSDWQYVGVYADDGISGTGTSKRDEFRRMVEDNVKWGTIKRFQKGIPNGQMWVFGYEWIDDQLTIVPEEAEVVRFMYREYMKGASRIEIGRILN